MTVAPPTQEQDLEAPIVDGFDRGVDRSEDHAVRQLLLDEPIEPLPSEEAEPEAPGPRTTRLRSAGIAGPIGFVLAILLAGLSG